MKTRTRKQRRALERLRTTGTTAKKSPVAGRVKKQAKAHNLSGGWWNEDVAREMRAKATESSPSKSPRVAPKVAKPKIPLLTYRERDDFILGLGFSSYAAYLNSELWQDIRTKVFASQGRRCWICRRRKKATQVHHEYYSHRNLSGESLAGLRTVCGPCHLLIEFTDGEKLSGRASRKKSALLRKASGKHKKARARRVGAAVKGGKLQRLFSDELKGQVKIGKAIKALKSSAQQRRGT